MKAVPFEQRQTGCGSAGGPERLARGKEHGVRRVRRRGVRGRHRIPLGLAVEWRPDHVHRRPGTDAADLAGEPRGALDQEHPALRQRRGPLLQPDQVPAIAGDRALRVAPVPMVLKAVAAECDRADHHGPRGIALAQPLNQSGQIVGVREAVADEQNPEVGMGHRLRRGAAARGQREKKGGKRQAHAGDLGEGVPSLRPASPRGSLAVPQAEESAAYSERN
jgi:hypothetical protein